MPNITAAHDHAAPAVLHVEDHGTGRPVVLVHGYPLDARFWERQIPALVAAGHRAVAHDRRGFGRSTASVDGADFDTFAADLDAVLTTLDLTDAVLVGYAMGSGEVVRYLRNYGSARVSGAVLLAPLPPFLLRTEQSPNGMDLAYFDLKIAEARADPVGFLTALVGDMFAGSGSGTGAETETETGAETEAAIKTWTPVATALPARTCAAAIPTWITDFREDVAALAALGLPTLIMHGTEDRVLPIEATSRPLHELLPDAGYSEVEGAPHGLVWTHADTVNGALIRFLAH
ncbi:bromoperoxidase [Catenulispora yoronensis]|uniref:Bromoperoxidase n=1 Tax=Catenulispora yoronensis TaxID=450799 RepID=A0ABP5FD20_9ACTN